MGASKKKSSFLVKRRKRSNRRRKRSNRRRKSQNGGSFRKKVAAVAEDIKNIFKSDKELQRIYHSKGGDEKVRKMIKSRNWARGISGTLLTIALALAVYSTAVKGKGGVVDESEQRRKKMKKKIEKSKQIMQEHKQADYERNRKIDDLNKKEIAIKKKLKNVELYSDEEDKLEKERDKIWAEKEQINDRYSAFLKKQINKADKLSDDNELHKMFFSTGGSFRKKGAPWKRKRSKKRR